VVCSVVIRSSLIISDEDEEAVSDLVTIRYIVKTKHPFKVMLCLGVKLKRG